MQDRYAKYPGRVKLTPVAGQDGLFDMTMADGATQEGTPPTKTNLLKDTTSKKYFASGDHTVDEVLSTLGKSLLLSGSSIKDPLGNLIKLPSAQLDSRVQIATGSYTGTGTGCSNNPTKIALPSFTKIVLIFFGDSYNCGIDGIINMTLYSNLNANEHMFATFARYREDAIYKGSDGSATLLSVYSNEGASGQFNSSGYKYEWVAIG